MSRLDQETGPDTGPAAEPGTAVDLVSGRALWRLCCTAEAPAQHEDARFLDLAAFADGLLDEEERERVAERIAADPAAASDVAAARALSSGGTAAPPAGRESAGRESAGLDPVALDRIVARVGAGIGEAAPEAAPGSARVLAFVPPARHGPMRGLAQWGSLAAGIAVASWLGFAMGSGALLSLNRLASSGPNQTVELGEGSYLPELLDPAIGFLRDSGEGQQT